MSDNTLDRDVWEMQAFFLSIGSAACERFKDPEYVRQVHQRAVQTFAQFLAEKPEKPGGRPRMYDRELIVRDFLANEVNSKLQIPRNGCYKRLSERHYAVPQTIKRILEEDARSKEIVKEHP